MKRNLLIVFVCLVVGYTVGTAQPRQFDVYGHGTGSCGNWTSGRQPAVTRAGEWNMSWVHGFISGAGYQSAGLRRTDTDGIMAWMDKYCTDNPLHPISRGASTLVEELREKTN